MKLVFHSSPLNTRIWIEGKELAPQDCSSLYSALGKLVYKNKKLFNIEEIKDYGKIRQSS